MTSNADTKHVDTLLALAVAFGDAREEENGARGGEPLAALEVLSALAPAVRQAVERRADWYASLPRQKQLDWLSHMLGRSRADAREARLDEHVHPSHVVEALSEEPRRVRELVMEHLPPALARAAAAELGVEPPRDASSRRHAPPDEHGSGAPSPEVVAVVRRVFLSRFKTLADVGRVTPLELLSGAELARLVRMLGVRETAVACRGIEAVEAVASFLRRFAPEDARAVAAHIRSLSEVSPARVAFAERVVREALLAEDDPGAMLNRAGLRLLAVTLSGREARARLRYAAQKLPAEAAGWLEEMARAGTGQFAASEAETREIVRSVARATEEVAASLTRGRRGARPRQRGATPTEVA